jgi:hypothetical protein
VNLNSDTIRIWDFFSWYYYDSMHGMFQMDPTTSNSTNDRVKIASSQSWVCPNTTHDGYRLSWYSYSPDFWFVNFNYDTTRYVYVCIAKTTGQLGNTQSSYLGWYAYSPDIGFQNFWNIQVESSVVVGTGSLTQDARQIKILGLATSQIISETSTWQFLQDVKLLWKSSKSELRKNIQENVVEAIKGIPNLDTTNSVISNLSGTTGWITATPGTNISAGAGRYFQLNGWNISISWNNLSGNKTLIVEGWNIYITGNIIWTGILGLIALERNGIGWNIYVHPNVTDIHAVLYADRSFLSYNGVELDGSTSDEDLANQLYIKGSLFSENTLWGFQLSKCPFYVTSANCNTPQKAAKYDLNYLRRYILVQPLDALGVPNGPKIPQFWAVQSLQTPSRPDFAEYAVIIEYDPRVQQAPPVILR